MCEASDRFHTRVSSISEPVCDYMKAAESAILFEEENRSFSSAVIVKRCEEIWVARKAQTLYDDFPALLDDRKDDHIARMFRLLSRVGAEALDPIVPMYERGVVAHHKRLDGPDVEKCITTYHGFVELTRTAFRDDKRFRRAVDVACRSFVNRVQNVSELLADHTDRILRKKEDTSAFDNIILVLSLIEEKDIFQAFHAKKMSRRLISQLSSVDDESLFITKLKESMGFSYVAHMQSMITDMATSVDLQESFKSADVAVDHSFDFGVIVLATNAWPIQPPRTELTIPKEMMLCRERFHEFYNKKHNGRRLNWMHHLSKGVLSTSALGSAKRQLCCSTYQMTVLLSFNDNKTMTTVQLVEYTGINRDQLHPVLRTLLKTRVIVCKPKDCDTITDAHMFAPNRGFKNKRLRININIKLESQVVEERKQSHAGLAIDRKHVVEACIVRVMKMRKQLDHRNLIAEVVEQLVSRFKPDIKIIKSCIGGLIEKEYLERKDGGSYAYLA